MKQNAPLVVVAATAAGVVGLIAVDTMQECSTAPLYSQSPWLILI